MKSVLKIYRENGIHELPMRMNRSLKLSKVGLRTNNLGGNRNSSLMGLKALLMA